MTIQTSGSTAIDNETDYFKKSPELSDDLQTGSIHEPESDSRPSQSPLYGVPKASGSVVKNSKETAYIGATHVSK